MDVQEMDILLVILANYFLLWGTFNIIMLVIPLVPTWNLLEVCAEIQ